MRHTIPLLFSRIVREWLRHSPHYPLKKTLVFSSPGFSSSAVHWVFLLWFFTHYPLRYYHPFHKKYIFLTSLLLTKNSQRVGAWHLFSCALLLNSVCSLNHWRAVLKAKQHYAAFWCSEPRCKPKRIRIRPQFKCFYCLPCLRRLTLLTKKKQKTLRWWYF